jgi:citrate synthase
MNENSKIETVHTRIWLEEPEPDNDFATRAAYCHGYDVYGEMLGNATWTEMIFLLFRGEAPSPEQTKLLDALAIALANPGPRDQSVHAAMCGGVGGSPAAACLMAALAVGAGHLSGAREVCLAMEIWKECGTNTDLWNARLAAPAAHNVSIWPDPEHPSGFEPYGLNVSTIVRQTLSNLARLSPGICLRWLDTNRQILEDMAGHPLSMSGVAAAALADLDFTPEQGEMLCLLLRLPGAAAHALEQKQYGHKRFPFFKIDLQDDPENKEK